MSNNTEAFFGHLNTSRLLHVEQVWEAFEIVLGWESRNKYRIIDENRRPLAFAAEKSTGFLGTIMRLVFKHWRSFDIIVYDENRMPVLNLHFPFRWFFKTLHISDANGRELGHLEQRFAIFRKKFDVHADHGQILARINSPFFKFWTFDFTHRQQKLGSVHKKWSGALGEIFTDKDNFVLSFDAHDLNPEMKSIMLATCLMIDIVYFENNQGGKGLLDLID